MKRSAPRSLNGDHNNAHNACVTGSHTVRGGGSSLATDVDGNPGMRDAQVAMHLLEVQRDLAIGLLPCASLIECLDLLLASAMRLPDFDCGGIYLCDEATGGLRLIAQRGLSEEFVKRAGSYPADSPQSRMVRAGKLVYAMRSDVPPEIGKSIATEGLEALAVLPMRDGDRVIAALNVSSHRYPRIEESSRVALESLVAQAEGAIMSIRAREARDLAERRLRLAVEGADLGTWVADLETGMFDASVRARELHGVAADVPLDLEAAVLRIHPDDRARVNALLQHSLVNGVPYVSEYRLADVQHDVRWIASNARFFDGNGGRMLYGISRDITLRKQAEAELIEARDELEIRVVERTAELEEANLKLGEEFKRLELALDASRAGTWAWEIRSNEVECDNRERALYGFEDDVAVSFPDYIERIHPDDRNGLVERLKRATMPGGPESWSIEFRVMHPDLGERWLGGLGSIERDDGGQAKRMVGINFDITERKQAERALRESNDLLTEFMRCSPIYSFIKIVTADESRVMVASENFREMIGIPGSCMVGKTMEELFPADLAAKITADDWAVISRGAMLKIDEEFNGRNYTTIKFPIVQGDRTLLAGYSMDVTDRVLAEKTMKEWNQTLERRVAERTAELNQSEARFRQLAEATFEGIAVTENGILVDGNPQLAKIHGHELSEMIGRSVMDFVAPESRSLIAERMRTGDEETYECLGLRKDGSTFPEEVRGCMRTWQGRQTRVTALRDLSSAKRAASKLHALQTELEHAQKLGLVSEISAGIIHQIGQPLCAMGANLAAAITGAGDCPVPKCGILDVIRDVNADVARLREIVVHMRALANPGRTNRARFDFNAMVSDVVRLLRHEATARQVVLTNEPGPDLPLLDGDPVQLSQVILNLARNAFDACSSVAPDQRFVRIRTRVADRGGVELDIRDSGTGIPPNLMEVLFTPFFTTKREGLGMGLRLSRTIIEAHGGTIEASNNSDGCGATFRVILPASR